MNFEEFFRKKKIDLAAFGKAEPALFSEFRTHYEQMGEKSFDHTKKYWFNKLRLIYRLAPEIKEEKVIIENRLAEQTITETLEETPPPANVGFKPRFKPGMTKPAEPASEQPKAETPATEPEKSVEPAAQTPSIGFKPKFKAGVTKPAQSTPEAKEEAKPEATEPAVPSAPALGFKPKFKAGVTKTIESAEEQKEESKPETAEQSASTPPAALGFKPKFKAGVTKTANSAPDQKEEPKVEPSPEIPTEDKPVEDTTSKPAYKPRFNMKNMKPKGEE